MIEMEHVSYRYGEDKNAPDSLRDVSLRVAGGEFVVLCGKSGCGKTTITRLINGLIPHYYEGRLQGAVRVGGKGIPGQPLAKTARQVGSVFQNPRSQFFNVDTTSELAFGCENLAMEPERITQRIGAAVDAFGLEALLGRSIFELSGGEKQRIACASVCAVDPDVFVLDEPSSNLDAAGVHKLQKVLATLKAAGKTVVVSEHRLAYLAELADRYILLENGKISREYGVREVEALGPAGLQAAGLRTLWPEALQPESPFTEALRPAPPPAEFPSSFAQAQNDCAQAISIEKLQCSYGGKSVLDIDRLSFPAGGVVAVIGHNGAGKSTLAGCLCGIAKCNGTVRVDGKLLSAKQRLQKSAMVMQDVNHQLFTESVAEELGLNLPEQRKQLVPKTLSALGLAQYAATHPLALSGGEKQRVAIGSAVCAGKDILIYDEPTSGQDYLNMRATCGLIRNAAQNAQLSLVITHDLEFILGCCTGVLHLAGGRVAAYYPLDATGTERVKQYFTQHREEPEMLKTKEKKQSGLAQAIGYAGRRKPLIFLGCALSAVAAVLGLVPYICVWLVARDALAVFPDLAAAPNLARWGWMAVWFAAANVVVYFAALMCTHLAAFRTARNIRNALMRHVVKLPLGFFVGNQSGLLRKQIDENAGLTEDMLAHKLPDLTAAIMTPIAAIALLFVFNWVMGLLCLLTMLIAIITMLMMMSGDNANFFHRYQQEIEKMSGEAVEYVRGIPVVKVFQQTIYSFKAFYNAILSYSDLAGKYAMSCRTGQTIFLTCVHGAFALLVPAALLLASGGNVLAVLVNFIFYALFAPACGGMINRIMYASDSIRQTQEAMFKLNRILDETTLPQAAAPKMPVGAGVEFRDVTFTYPGMEKEALKHVSFSVPEGGTVALVGPSGGGKTTAASLIPRFWDVQGGAVLVGGVDVREVAQDALMRQVAFVFQDTKLFKKSLYENIRTSRPDATREQVLAAARAAQCDDILEKLPDGIDTVVGTKGVYLSGGEAQRIALARAILKDAPVIVLDEATAFADPENEYQIQKAFEELTRGKTVLMIAHRLSTIQNADQILVLVGGEVIERGTQAELLEQQGKYAAMWADYRQAARWQVGALEVDKEAAV